MDFSFTAEQERIREAIAKLCTRFGDDYWLERDREGGFPADFHQALARDGWLGIAMPEAYGGAGLGIAEAAVMMQAISESGAGFSGASAVHMNIFRLNPVVVFGDESQKRRMLPPLIEGKHRACFAVTEPDVGLNTKKIKVKAEKKGGDYIVSGQKVWISTAQVAEKVLLLARSGAGLTLFYTDFDRDYIEVREIEKMGRHAVDSNQVFFDGLLRCLPAGGDDPRRLRLRARVPRRALPARVLRRPHRPGHAAADPVLHRRARARPAEILLTYAHEVRLVRRVLSLLSVRAPPQRHATPALRGHAARASHPGRGARDPALGLSLAAAAVRLRARVARPFRGRAQPPRDVPAPALQPDRRLSHVRRHAARPRAILN